MERYEVKPVIPIPWKYNPSSFKQRTRVALVAVIGVLLSTYMGLFQWWLLDWIWDPIFGEQSEFVLDSDLSHWMTRLIHMPDAILGAIAYLGDIIFALAGSERRWQYRPWLVIIFGIDVIPLGVVSIILIFAQGFIVNAWCFFCLVTAVVSIILIILAYDEVLSCILFLYKVWNKTRSYSLLWKTFCGIPSMEAYEIGETMIQQRKQRYVGKKH